MARNNHVGARPLPKRLLTTTASMRCRLNDIELDAQVAPRRAVRRLAAMLEDVSAELQRMRMLSK